MMCYSTSQNNDATYLISLYIYMMYITPHMCIPLSLVTGDVCGACVFTVHLPRASV